MVKVLKVYTIGISNSQTVFKSFKVLPICLKNIWGAFHLRIKLNGNKDMFFTKK